MLLVQLSAGFWSLPALPTSKLGPSGADSRVGGFVYILAPCGSLQQTLLWGWEFLLLRQAPQIFLVRSFEALFPCAGALGGKVCLGPQLFLPVYPHVNVGLPSLPVLSARLPISALPTGLDGHFFFNSLVVGLPYSLIFWRLWLFLFLNLLLSLFW